MTLFKHGGLSWYISSAQAIVLNICWIASSSITFHGQTDRQIDRQTERQTHTHTWKTDTGSHTHTAQPHCLMSPCLPFLIIQNDQGSLLQVFGAAESPRDDTTFEHMDYSKPHVEHGEIWTTCRLKSWTAFYALWESGDSSLSPNPMHDLSEVAACWS